MPCGVPREAVVSAFVNRGGRRDRISTRVYLGGALALGLLIVAVLTPGARRARADVDLTVNPAMTRGPATAPVTIVEFSDYQ